MKKLIFVLMCLVSCSHVMSMFMFGDFMVGDEERLLGGDSEGRERQLVSLVEQVEKGEADPSILNVEPDSKFGNLRVLIQKQEVLPLVERLLKAGADPNYDDGFNVPLDVAAEKEKIELLLEYGADVKKSTCCVGGVLTGYMIKEISIHEALDAMKLLLQKGADIHSFDFEHPLYEIATTSLSRDDYEIATTSLSRDDKVALLSRDDKVALLLFYLRHGSNPHVPFGFKADLSVYEILKRNPENRPWVDFIKKERGWLLAKPFLIALRKEQGEDCHIRKLPADIMEHILNFVGIERSKKELESSGATEQ